MKTKHIIIAVIAFALILLLISKCNCRKEKKPFAENFIKVPIEKADVPCSDYTVTAENGDTIVYKSGSVIVFPPNAFVDQNGKLIKGKVDIKYREFRDPVDFFLSGIPMNYDSAGKQYVFESAGMCDIRATQNGSPVFVNPNGKPQINIASNNNDISQNLYYLDTVSRKWVNLGKSEILENNGMPEKKDAIEKPVSVEDIPKPVKPSLALDNLPIIRVRIDTASFDELKAYDNLKFQIDKDETRFDPEESNGTWSDIKLIKRKNTGSYNIRFSNLKKTIEYRVHPVLDEKDLAKAMVAYDVKLREYENKIEKRLNAYNENKQQHIIDSINDARIDKENEKTLKLNALIEARNVEIEKESKKIQEENNKIYNYNIDNSLIRSFEINNFGVWNCDQPILQSARLKIKAKYIDEEKNVLEMYNVNIFFKDLNAIFPAGTEYVFIPEKTDVMLIGVTNGKLAYLTYEEMKKLNLVEGTVEATFPMHVVSAEHNNYEFIRSILGV